MKIDNYLHTLKNKKHMLLSYMFIYLLSKNLLDDFTGVFEAIYYVCIVIGIYFLFDFLVNKGNGRIKKHIRLLMLLWSLYVGFCFFVMLIRYQDMYIFIAGFRDSIFYSGLLFPIIGYLMDLDSHRVNFVLNTILSMTLINLCVTFYESATNSLFISIYMDPHHMTRYGLLIDGVFIIRPRGLVGSFQTNSLILGIGSLISAYKVTISKERVSKIAFSILSIMFIFGSVLTYSRGPLVAVILGFLMSGVLIDYRKPDSFIKNHLMKPKPITAILITGCLALLLFYFFMPNLFYRLVSIFNWSSDDSNLTRKGIWMNMFGVFLDNPILGIGPGMTGSVTIHGTGVGVTESGVLKRLVETGIIGFLLYYYYLYKGIIVDKIIANKSYLFLSLSVIIAILIEDVVLQITEDGKVSFLLWFFIALRFVRFDKRNSIQDVSIIIPYYYGEKHLERLSKSIKNNVDELKKNEVNCLIELIFVIDSPNHDEAKAHIEQVEFGVQPRIIFNKVNLGIHKTRTVGVNNSTGEYVIMLDQDDEITSNMIRSHIETIENNDVSVSNGSVQKNGLEIDIYRNRRSQNYAMNESGYLCVRDLIVSPGQCLIKKSSIPSIWLEDSITFNGSDDYYLWILMFNEKASFVPNYAKVYTHIDTGENISLDMEKLYVSTQEFLDLLSTHSEYPRIKVSLLRRQIEYKRLIQVNRSNYYKQAYKYIDLFVVNTIYQLIFKGM